MITIIVSSDPRLAGPFRAALLAVEPALRCQVLAASDPLPLCALYILCVPADGFAEPVPAPNAGALRWRVDFGTDAAVPEFAWDDCFTWPVDAGQLAHHLAQARTQLRARSGLAERKVPDLALQRVVELAAESIEVVDPAIRLLYANPAFEQVTGWAMENAVEFTAGELFRAGTHDSAYYADIGVTLTALTLAREHLQSVEAALDSACPSRHLIRERMAELDNVLTVSLENAQRAADLISNFKKIAVDQASEVLRSVEMVDYLRAVASHYAPTLRRARIGVTVKGRPVDLLTRPGAIAQVITNLIQNAVVHAFDENSADRRVDITCPHGDRQVQVCVRDNGKGMSTAVAGRIFDPFFTTRMGSGGSGLGMTIVHNLIADMLQGAISIKTAPGQGLEVLISLPRQPVMTGAEHAGRSSTKSRA